MDVLAMRLVDSWTRIGLLMLCTMLIALGILIVRPRSQGRRIPDESGGSRRYFEETRKRADSVMGVLHGTEKVASETLCGDGDPGGMVGGRKKRGDEEDGLDVEDTCAVQ